MNLGGVTDATTAEGVSMPERRVVGDPPPAGTRRSRPLPVSATRTLPPASNAAELGRESPLPTETCAPPTGTLTTRSLPVSATSTSPAAFVETPSGRRKPEPTVLTGPVPLGYLTTRSWLVSAT